MLGVVAPDRRTPSVLLRLLTGFAVAIASLAALVGYLAATYTHEETSAFDSPWAQWGQLALALLALAMAVWALTAQSNRRRLVGALAGFALVGAWCAVLILGWG